MRLCPDLPGKYTGMGQGCIRLGRGRHQAWGSVVVIWELAGGEGLEDSVTCIHKIINEISRTLFESHFGRLCWNNEAIYSRRIEILAFAADI